MEHTFQFYMPTRIFQGSDCLSINSHHLKRLGRKALIVTGINSTKLNGSLEDVISALEKENIASKKVLSKKNEEKDVLHVKPLPVKFTEEEGIPKEVIATISACVAYLLAEEEELAETKN